MLNNPYGIAVDSAGNLYIADLNNGRVRKVSPDGIITTVAGNGDFDNYGNGGPATQAAMAAPSGVAVDDSAGTLYIADAGSDQLRKVTSDGIISLLAGTGAHGFSGDGGPAVKASLAEPTGIAVDTKGDVFFADVVNRACDLSLPTESSPPSPATATEDSPATATPPCARLLIFPARSLSTFPATSISATRSIIASARSLPRA